MKGIEAATRVKQLGLRSCAQAMAHVMSMPIQNPWCRQDPLKSSLIQ